jgi:hypothetical protein
MIKSMEEEYMKKGAEIAGLLGTINTYKEDMKV